jgi:ketosteroid isomerase-like protein
MTRSTREAIDAFFDALGRRDWTLMTDLLDENIAYRVPASLNVGMALSGRSAALDILRRVDQIYRSGTTRHHRDLLVVEGEYGACRLTMEGVRTDGAAYRNRYVMVFGVRAGRIIEIDEHLDTLYLQQIRAAQTKA